MKKKRQSRNYGLTIFVFLTLLAPLVAGAVSAFRVGSESPLVSDAKPVPLVGAIERVERNLQSHVTIRLVEAETFKPSLSTSGLVTLVNVATDQQISSGHPVLHINDKPIVAYSGTAPLFRDIYRGLSGRDVSTAQQFLTDLGFYTGSVDGKAGWATEKAIIAFNRHFGYGKDNPSLMLENLVWIGQSAATVSSVEVELGAQVEPGTPIFATPKDSAKIEVEEKTPAPVGTDLLINISGYSFTYQAGSKYISEPQLVADLSALLVGFESLGGQIQLQEPQVFASVNASAIVADPSGTTCIFPGPDEKPIVVDVHGGALSAVDLPAEMIGQPILLNPREILSELSCAG